MAEVLSKISMFSLERQSVSIFPKSCNFNISGPFCFLRLDSSDFDLGRKRVVLQKNEYFRRRGFSRSQFPTINALTSPGIGKAHNWWEKGLKPNMKEVPSAQELVDSLKKAGDQLVVVGFFSPACGGCKALHYKICQLAEMNPDVQFLQVNHEEHKSMCYSLNVHVLPLFRFYRGAHGRLCSFSCTNATIKKFKEALIKHSSDRCSLGPAKGLEEKELVALASNTDLSFTYAPKSVEVEPVPTSVFQRVPVTEPFSSNKQPIAPSTMSITQDSEDKTFVISG